jgi:hypothetical protein
LQFFWFRGEPRTCLANIKWMNMLLQVHSCINPYIFVCRTKDVRRGEYVAKVWLKTNNSTFIRT